MNLNFPTLNVETFALVLRCQRGVGQQLLNLAQCLRVGRDYHLFQLPDCVPLDFIPVM